MIELLDDQFGRLFDHLETTGQLDDSLIVFHSNHGEMLGDHGLLYKGCRFFEGLVHGPLIFFWQGRILNGVSDALVELVDLAPKLLEAAGQNVPEAMQGRSLMPLLTGQADKDTHKAQVVSQFNDALGSAGPTAQRAPPTASAIMSGPVKPWVSCANPVAAKACRRWQSCG